MAKSSMGPCLCGLAEFMDEYEHHVDIEYKIIECSTLPSPVDHNDFLLAEVKFMVMCGMKHAWEAWPSNVKVQVKPGRTVYANADYDKNKLCLMAISSKPVFTTDDLKSAHFLNISFMLKPDDPKPMRVYLNSQNDITSDKPVFPVPYWLVKTTPDAAAANCIKSTIEHTMNGLGHEWTLKLPSITNKLPIKKDDELLLYKPVESSGLKAIQAVNKKKRVVGQLPIVSSASAGETGEVKVEPTEESADQGDEPAHKSADKGDEPAHKRLRTKLPPGSLMIVDRTESS